MKTKKRKTKTEITVPVVSTYYQGNGPVSGEERENTLPYRRILVCPKNDRKVIAVIVTSRSRKYHFSITHPSLCNQHAITIHHYAARNNHYETLRDHFARISPSLFQLYTCTRESKCNKFFKHCSDRAVVDDVTLLLFCDVITP